MTPQDEAASVEMIADLARLEADGARCDARIGPFSMFNLIAVLQLADRNPNLSATLRWQVLRPMAYPTRGDSSLVRVYVELRIPPEELADILTDHDLRRYLG